MVAHVPRPCELSVVEFLHELGCSTEHGDGGDGTGGEGGGDTPRGNHGCISAEI